MDREAWRAAVPGFAKSWTQLSDWTGLNLRTQESFPVYVYLFLALLGLCCAGFPLAAVSGRAAPVAAAWASHCGGFSHCGAWAPGVRVSVVAVRGL